MHFQVVSISTESGNGSKLDFFFFFFFFFFLLEYNLPRGTIHHTAVNQHNLGQQTRIIIVRHCDKTL